MCRFLIQHHDQPSRYSDGLVLCKIKHILDQHFITFRKKIFINVFTFVSAQAEIDLNIMMERDNTIGEGKLTRTLRKFM